MFDTIKKIFQKQKALKPQTPAASEVMTAPLTQSQLESVSQAPVRYYPPQLAVGCAQSVGKQRDHNEDTLYTFYTSLADGDGYTPLGLFMVADGMGGHLHGEIASSTATRAMADYLIKKIYPSVMGLDPQPQSVSLQEIMEAAVSEAQEAVRKRAPGGGTTLTAALVMGERVTIAHVGDSRAYFGYPDGRLEVLTQDHSLVRRLVELEQLTEEQARLYPQKNVLYRALGQADPFRPDLQTLVIPHPGYLLICSDGLWGLVQDNLIFEIVKNAANVSAAAHQLVEAANQAGGPDNISVILVQFLE